MYGAVVLVSLVVQAAFGAWASRWIASQRAGASVRLWTVLGVVLGVAGPLTAWEFAGWRNGQGGVQQLRRERRK